MLLPSAPADQSPEDDPRLIAQYLFEGNYSDESRNGHGAAEFGTFFSLGQIEPLSDLMDTDPQRGGVYSYTWEEVFYDWENGGIPRNNSIDLEASAPLPPLPADTGITLMAWVNRAAVNTMNNGGNTHDGSIFQLGNCGDRPIATMAIRLDGTVTGYLEGDLIGGGEQVLITSNSFLPPNEWHHVAVAFDRANDSAIAYVDGVAQTGQTDISSVGDGELDFDRAYLGTFCNRSKAFVGQIDDARIYYGTLSGAEVADIAANNSAPSIASFAASTDLLAAAGMDVNLSWSAANFCELMLEPGGIMLGSADGAIVVTPAETTTYELTARNGSGLATEMLTVVVGEAPAILDFTAERTTVRPGAEVKFSWQVAGAESLSIDRGVSTGDPKATVTSTTAFTLTATNAAGASTAEVTVDVTPVVAATFLIDFTDTNTAAGRPGAVAADGNFWNHAVNYRDGRINLVDTTNDTGQGIGLAVVDAFDQLSTNEAEGADAYTDRAVTDGFLSDVVQSDGYAELLLDGLDATGATAYDLTLFSSISAIADVSLVVRFTLTGRESTTVTLDSNGNISQTVTAAGICPADDGTILVQLQPDSDTGLGAGINVMQIDTRLAPPPFVVTSLTINPANNRPTISWGAVPGRTYAVERSTDLLTWLEREDSLIPAGLVGAWEDPEPLSGDVYYRIRAAP